MSDRSSQFQARADEQLARQLPATREEALAIGAKMYRGNPCRRGHTSGRYTAGQSCVQCLKDAYREQAGERRPRRPRELVKAERAARRVEEAPAATREEARARRAKLYVGDPCLMGHTSGRYTSTGQCAECDKLRRKDPRLFRVEAAKAKQERQRELAARRAEELERRRREAAAKGNKRLERDLAAAQVAQARRATGERALTGFTAEEQAQIDAAVAAGKLIRIENGTWDHREAEPKRRW